MAGGKRDSSLTRVQPFFNTLLERDPTGSSWLGDLLGASPSAQASLGPLANNPGPLLPKVSSVDEQGRMRCFEYAVDPPRELLRWFIDHPDQLVWPAGQSYSGDTMTRRRSLLDDVPPGSRTSAQKLARELASTRSLRTREWWRFEGTSMIDCMLETEILVISIEGKRTEGISTATHWYPKRSQLVRNIEAAKSIAGDSRNWVSILMSEHPIPEGTKTGLDAVLADSTPHLEAKERASLSNAYLGNVTWSEACDAVGIEFGSLPDTTNDI